MPTKVPCCPEEFSRIALTPKSVIFTSPLWLISRFAGFKSRWTTCFSWWRQARPLSTCISEEICPSCWKGMADDGGWSSVDRPVDISRIDTALELIWLSEESQRETRRPCIPGLEIWRRCRRRTGNMQRYASMGRCGWASSLSSTPLRSVCEIPREH